MNTSGRSARRLTENGHTANQGYHQPPPVVASGCGDANVTNGTLEVVDMSVINNSTASWSFVTGIYANGDLIHVDRWESLTIDPNEELTGFDSSFLHDLVSGEYEIGIAARAGDSESVLPSSPGVLCGTVQVGTDGNGNGGGNGTQQPDLFVRDIVVTPPSPWQETETIEICVVFENAGSVEGTLSKDVFVNDTIRFTASATVPPDGAVRTDCGNVTVPSATDRLTISAGRASLTGDVVSDEPPSDGNGGNGDGEDGLQVGTGTALLLVAILIVAVFALSS